MVKTALISRKISSDTKPEPLTAVTSLTVSNYGSADLYLKVNDIERLVPAFNPSYVVPYGAYTMDGDGTYSDIRLEFRFGPGTKEAILDYRKLSIEPKCDQ